MRRRQLAALAVVVLAVLEAEVLRVSACCANKCSGHGYCQTGTCTCQCHSQWDGADCSYRQCPSGKQWVGDASATDTIHQTNAVCSNVGSCGTGDGRCTCQDGFDGLACERLACPLNCNKHGRCISLKDAAVEKDDRHFFRELTYDSQWDASRIYGCQCDVGYTGYDCSKRECPSGDDPLTTGQVDEVQVIECTCPATCSGNFYLSFRGEVTGAISFSADAAALKSALEALPTVHGVSVALTGGTEVCDADGASAAVTFTKNPGDVPTLRVNKNDLSSGGTPTIVVHHSGQTSGQGVSSVVGTKEDLPCNGRGTCDHGSGLCTCYTGFTSSDRAGGAGYSGDCGFESVAATACPGSSSCSGHGTCSGATTYVCTCYDGYTGADCNTRVCPSGKAWFNEPGESLPGYVSVSNGASTVTTTSDLRNSINRGDTIVISGVSLTVSTNTGDTFDGTNLPLASAFSGTTVAFAEAYARPENAHHLVECSNRGTCDTVMGTCSCMTGFTGFACQQIKCPDLCSKMGACLSLARFAQETEANGDATSFTYGLDPSSWSTWDHDQIFGCKCDRQLIYGGHYDAFGHDCSKLKCPSGDDPSTSGVHEVQTITCSATGGTFTVTFRQQTTAAIQWDATAAEVKAALEALTTIGTVSVAFDSGSAACSSGGVAIAVTFTTELGDLPLVTTTASSLTGGSGTAAVVETTKGTREDVECSKHGLCDRSNGACTCFSGYVSSDGGGNPGTRGDCGARDSLFTSA